ncbi:hypothetical protein SLEP1_g49368 [Rubroshorea leprosula]|uniref:Zinc finger PHD-type domain-containing protein n=1 Tax=Rubroshorea leprosula TaxID=152421 RepID=A0AAV5LWW0_9ROSI|nr:hypothetical protein SLEP1_g49368 [Rubroshorea leprosula]
MKKLNHFSHPHPLVLVEDQEMDSIGTIYYCSACQERVEGSSYNCSECDFCLHKSCAELPREINHPFHASHPLILYGEPQYATIVVGFSCNSCQKVKGKEFVYHCSSCEFDLDISCALLPNLITGDFPKLKHFSRQHSLFFIQNHYIEPQDQSCSACKEPISGPVYCCFDCEFFLHQKCFELPLEIEHPSHRKHSLTLLPNPPPHPEKCSCHLCTKAYKGFIYYCSLCEFGIMIKYTFSDHKVIKISSMSIHLPKYRDHSLSFVMLVVQMGGTAFLICDYFVHVDCAMDKDIFIQEYENPFLKLGLTHKYRFHEHRLTIAKKDYFLEYLKCSVCDKYCKQVFLKCTQSGCKYVIDWECRLHIRRSKGL